MRRPKSAEELQASVESIKEELAGLKNASSEFEQAKAAQEAEAQFNSRMEEILDSIYDLEESDSSFIAEKLKGLDSSEEAFASGIEIRTRSILVC